MSTREGIPQPFNIDPAIPQEGKDQFNKKIDEMKSDGLTEARTTYFTLESAEDYDAALAKLPLQEGEQIVDKYVQPDDMEGAEANDKAQDIVYVLVGKKA